jgi:hypothetical protein
MSNSSLFMRRRRQTACGERESSSPRRELHALTLRRSDTFLRSLRYLL